MAKNILPFVSLLLVVHISKAQEYLTGITTFPAIKNLTQQASSYAKDTNSLELPFIDDFSELSVFPNQAKWSDSTAYINHHLLQSAISIGVATLDGMDSHGNLYPLSFGEFYRKGDSLTSRPINLSQLSPSDSIYLSFFYLPGGLADKPETGDSLLVDFWDGQTWENLWKVPGQNNSQWQQVLLPVANQKYFTNQFRFRFRNIVSPSGGGIVATNCDFWHIDYVRLDKNRNQNDTIVRDVSITRPPNATLNQFNSIPWRHYQNYFFLTYGSVDFYFTNHDNVNNQNVTSYYKVSKLNDTYSDSVLIGAMNCEAFEKVEFSAPINRNLYPLNDQDSSSFLLETKIITSSSYPIANKVGKRLHNFSNYYAYDDGTAENGYDLNQAGNRVAVFFNMYMEDSLRGVYIYFNPTNDSLYAVNYFSICVWEDNGGIPGNLIYQKNGCTPKFDNHGQFAKYLFDSAIYVPRKFFIGYQKNTNQFMSVGVDMSTQLSQRNFYNLGQQWVASSINRALMIRPIVSRKLLVGISQIAVDECPEPYPNPASNEIIIRYPDPIKKWQITLFDLTGKVQFNAIRPEKIDCQNLPDGLFILRFTEGRETYTRKIMIQR
ncbi:MAG TPA: T9SS type A sorting domain-containing protein [Salinivirgaceae bacterium]|nr:T9SS type A sorting domain-containing protein [Salinivirgaceae bacterium]